jgi:2,4-dienoyl-CoA reductase-like NADH-dependent reductase (Old Yellow Enzyme family)
MLDDPGRRPLLFTPLTLRSVTLPNRVVIAPMVQYRAKPDGLANDFHMAHLAKFALGKAGTVFTEAVAVEPRGRVSHGDLGLWDDAQIAPLRRITDYIRSEGCVPAVQLAHGGRKASGQPAMDGGGPVGPAEIARGLQPWPTVGPTSEPVNGAWPAPAALTVEGIAEIVAAFADATRRAEAAGFDIAEVHGAHGYLIASFLSPISNTRNDGYGGDRAGRMRFALDVTRAVRAAWPSHKPLFFRVSSVDGAVGGWGVEDTVALALELKACGVDVVDCSSGGLTGSATNSTVPRGLGFQVPFAAAVRKAGVPSMAVGLILDGPQAEAVLQEGAADLIAIGREALRDPFWALHAAEALGCDPQYVLWPREYGWWLDKRARTLADAGVRR